jgi:heptose I phosphotransferase
MSHAAPASLAAPSLLKRLLRGTRQLRQSADWPAFAGADWPERIMFESVTDLLHEKQGRAIARWTLTDGPRRLRVFLKRHYKLPVLHGILAMLFPRLAWSPGLQEWEHLEWAKAAGFLVPRAVAAGQLIGPGLKLQGFIAVEELAGMLPLHLALPLAEKRLGAMEFLRFKRGLVAEVARIACELHRRKVFHKDLYFCHFYIDEAFTRQLPESWFNRVTMIDLHRMARHPFAARWFQVKDLAQFLYSSDVPGVTARDRLRFWKFYRGARSESWLRPFIRWKWQLYRRHARRKKRTG